MNGPIMDVPDHAADRRPDDAQPAEPGGAWESFDPSAAAPVLSAQEDLGSASTPYSASGELRSTMAWVWVAMAGFVVLAIFAAVRQARQAEKRAAWEDAIRGTESVARQAETMRMDALGDFRKAQLGLEADREKLLKPRAVRGDDERSARWR